jgi:hypothetical protein
MPITRKTQVVTTPQSARSSTLAAPGADPLRRAAIMNAEVLAQAARLTQAGRGGGTVTTQGRMAHSPIARPTVPLRPAPAPGRLPPLPMLTRGPGPTSQPRVVEPVAGVPRGMVGTLAGPVLPIVLVNLATTAGLGAELPAALPKLLEAWLESLHIFASVWGAQIRARIASSPTDRAPDEVAVNFRDTLPDPTAAALHQVVAGVPDIELALADFDDLFVGPDSLAVGGDHELKETLVDAGANGWKDRGNGSSEAEEVVDRVQDTVLTSSDGVSLANFLLPSAWIPGSPGPWDYASVLTAQDGVTPEGYVILASSPTDPHDLMGEERERNARDTRRGAQLVELTDPQSYVRLYAYAHFSARRHTQKSHPWSRLSRRGVQLLPLPAPAEGSHT